MILATWINADRTRAVQLEDDGTVAVIEREKAYHTWGPPLILHLESAVDELREMIEVVNLSA